MKWKKVVRWLLVAFGLVVVVISIPQLILSSPGMLFPEKFSTERIILFSDRPIDPVTRSLLDSVSARLSSSGFFTGKKKLYFYLCHDETLAAFINKISGSPEGAGFHHFSGNIYLFPDRIEKFKRENERASPAERLLLQYSYQGFDLVDLMAHEGFHRLHSDTIGFWTFRRKMPAPHWKAEGFAEYYSYRDQKRRDSTYDFHGRVGLYLKYKNQFSLFYFKAGLLYEFLAEQEQVDFWGMMDDEVTEERTYAALIQWYQDSGSVSEISGKALNSF